MDFLFDFIGAATDVVFDKLLVGFMDDAEFKNGIYLKLGFALGYKNIPDTTDFKEEDENKLKSIIGVLIQRKVIVKRGYFESFFPGTRFKYDAKIMGNLTVEDFTNEKNTNIKDFVGVTIQPNDLQNISTVLDDYYNMKNNPITGGRRNKSQRKKKRKHKKWNKSIQKPLL
jgi:hypothetical protein